MMTIEVTPVLLASHFVVGFLHASGWVYFQYRETGKFKSDQYTWPEIISGFITATCMGYAGVVILLILTVVSLVFAAIQLLFWVILDKIKLIKWPSLVEVGFYSFLFLLLGGLITECTAPREGANCGDGSHSSATGRGACSWHGGVSSWDKDYWWEDDSEELSE